MYYLSACKRACLKVMIAMFYFCHSKIPSNIIKNVFNSISIYSILLLNKHKKQMCFKKKKFLFFWRREKWPNFSFKSLPFPI